MNAYIKAIIGAAVPLLGAVSVWIDTGQVNAPEFALLALAFLQGVAVYALRNSGRGAKRYSKFIAAALLPIATALVQAYATGAWGQYEWITLITGFVTALLVFGATNVDPYTREPLPNDSFPVAATRRRV